MQIFRLMTEKRGCSSKTCVCLEWGFNHTRSIRCPDVAGSTWDAEVRRMSMEELECGEDAKVGLDAGCG